MAGFGGGFFSVFAGSIWWWVSVLAGSVWWLGFVDSRVLVVVVPGFVTLSLRSYLGFVGFGCAWRPKIWV